MPRNFRKGGVSNSHAGYYDTRTGLGYGRSTPSGRHEPRQANSNFPYTEPDQYIDDEYLYLPFDEDELRSVIRKMGADHTRADPYANRAKLEQTDKIGSANYRSGNYRRTGTRRGYASSPPPKAAGEVEIPLYNLRNIESPDERALTKLRILIAKIVKQQELYK